jgi:hypothetical protein
MKEVAALANGSLTRLSRTVDRLKSTAGSPADPTPRTAAPPWPCSPTPAGTSWSPPPPPRLRRRGPPPGPRPADQGTGASAGRDRHPDPAGRPARRLSPQAAGTGHSLTRPGSTSGWSRGCAPSGAGRRVADAGPTWESSSCRNGRARMSPFSRLGARVDQLAAESGGEDASSGWSGGRMGRRR